jgi:hypothetical protein
MGCAWPDTVRTDAGGRVHDAVMAGIAQHVRHRTPAFAITKSMAQRTTIGCGVPRLPGPYHTRGDAPDKFQRYVITSVGATEEGAGLL